MILIPAAALSRQQGHSGDTAGTQSCCKPTRTRTGKEEPNIPNRNFVPAEPLGAGRTRMRDPQGSESLRDMQRPGSGGDTRRGHLGATAPLLWTSHGQTELFGSFLHPKFDTEAAGNQIWTKGCTGTTSLPSPTSPVPTLAFLLAKFPRG